MTNDSFLEPEDMSVDELRDRLQTIRDILDAHNVPRERIGHALSINERVLIALGNDLPRAVECSSVFPGVKP